jgi:hypothetical protein
MEHYENKHLGRNNRSLNKTIVVKALNTVITVKASTPHLQDILMDIHNVQYRYQAVSATLLCFTKLCDNRKLD